MNRPAIKFYCSRWGYEDMPWKIFIAKAKHHSFHGVEVIALRYPEQKNEMLDQLEREQLEYTLIYTEKKTVNDFKKYLDVLEKDLYEIAITYRTKNAAPQFIISQTGREYYSRDQAGACFAVCDKVAKETGIRIIQETHRYRWSFAAHIVKEYLQEFPDLRLALDISHWFCVSESYLEDQVEAVNLALERTDHLHARIGHTQGPQVTDPRAPENAIALEHHLKCWEKWIEMLTAKGVSECTITPEFGPYPYMTSLPFINQPISDQWAINCWIKDTLAAKFCNR